MRGQVAMIGVQLYWGLRWTEIKRNTKTIANPIDELSNQIIISTNPRLNQIRKYIIKQSNISESINLTLNQY